jgi:hypothetical protein
MSISKKNGRRRRIGPRRNRRRFASVERLESRILLDGSGGLGANAANDQAVITNSQDYYQLTYAYDVGRLVVRDSLQHGAKDQGTVVATELKFQGTPIGNDIAVPSQADAADHEVFGVQGYRRPVAILADTSIAISNTESLLYSTSSSVAAVIPMPSAQPEYLPADSNLPHDNWKDIVRKGQPEIGSSRSGDARIAVAESNADSSESGEASRGVAPHSATQAESRAIALSSDRYFASYARRTSAGLSTHSVASESRQHVIATVHHVAPAHRASHGMPLVSFHSRGASDVTTVSAAGGTTATWWRTRSQQVATVSRSDGIDQTADVHLTRISPENEGVSERDRLDRNPRATDMSLRYQQVRELALSLYEPVSFVVGVSLVSAHAIAETNAAKKHPSQALRKR